MGHFYTREGESRFDATPALAKKQGLICSVTEQFRILSKPGLAVWLEKELARAAYDHPPREGETLDVFFRRIKATRYRNTSGAAELGSDIHAGIEHCLKGGSLDTVNPAIRKYVEPAVTYFKSKNFVVEHLEKIVVNLENTFAGTVDLIGKTSQDQPFVLDWKSKKSKPGLAMTPYNENKWQLGAYAVGVYGEDMVMDHKVWAANCFISTTEFGDDGLARFEAYSYEPKVVCESWLTAKTLFELYRKVTGHDPR